MLNSELHPDRESLALIKSLLHDHSDAEEKMKHLREAMSDNVILSGWISHAQNNSSPEEMILSLRERVEKFESNQHLREMEGVDQILAEETIVDSRTSKSYPKRLPR